MDLRNAPVAEPSAAAHAAATFLTRLLPAPRAFDVRLQDGTVVPGETPLGADAPDLTVATNSPGALRRMLRPPVELALARLWRAPDRRRARP